MNFAEALNQSLTYLSSAEAENSIKRDPYWPKWNSPWWYMCLIFELSLAEQIPKSIVTTMVTTLKKHYLPVFPITESEVPVGTDPYRHKLLVCALSATCTKFYLPAASMWIKSFRGCVNGF